MPKHAAHDLRNLLTPFVGNIDLARRDPTCSASVAMYLDRALVLAPECFALAGMVLTAAAA
jgi:hypothetical protein